jgi:hypothetical protein
MFLPALAGCAISPATAQREFTAADAYVQEVERQARNSSSPVQVHWAHPPRSGQVRAAGTRVWRWSDAPEADLDSEPGADGGSSGDGPSR